MEVEKFLNSRQNITTIFCTAVIATFLFGTASLSAQLFLACMERYKVVRKEAAIPFTLIYIFRTISGPVTGYLGLRYGAQIITEIGCIISAIGIGGCYFAEDISTVSILWGCVYGIGCGFGTLLLPNILHDFFDNHYDKAHGIYMAGCGIGSFFLPLLAEILLEQYGTSGTFLILGAVALNSFPVTLFLRFSKRRSNIKELPRTEVFTVSNGNSEVVPSLQRSGTGENNKTFSLSTDDKDTSAEERVHPKEISSDTEGIKFIDVDLRNASDVCQFPTNVSAAQVTNENLARFKSEQPPSPSEFPTSNDLSNNMHVSDETSNSKTTNTSTGNGILEALSIFIDPAFILILVTQCFSLFIFLTWYTIVIDFARDVGVASRQEVYVLMSLTITDTLGRALLGSITDKGCISKDKFYSLSCVLLGVTMCVMTTIWGFTLYMITISIIGLLLGGLMMVNSGILIPFIPKEKLIIAMPCRLFLYPALGFAKPFLIDHFRQLQGSYNGLLYFMTALCVLTSFLCLLLPAAKRLRERWEQKS